MRLTQEQIEEFRKGIVPGSVVNEEIARQICDQAIEAINVVKACQDIARMVGAKNRTEFGIPVGQPIPGQPPGPLLSLHDAWVACSDTIFKEIEKLKAAN